MPDKKHGDRPEDQEPTADEILERLVPDPNNPDVVPFMGSFLGKSSREDYWRLYLATDLRIFLEFRKQDTLDAKHLASGEVIVWLKPEARVHKIIRRSGPAEFLQGSILNENLGTTTTTINTMMRRAMGLGEGGCGGPQTGQAQCGTLSFWTCVGMCKSPG